MAAMQAELGCAPSPRDATFPQLGVAPTSCAASCRECRRRCKRRYAQPSPLRSSRARRRGHPRQGRPLVRRDHVVREQVARPRRYSPKRRYSPPPQVTSAREEAARASVYRRLSRR
eukprot:scaffold195666_cov33-Tisochrysis_lutea.AAC.1